MSAHVLVRGVCALLCATLATLVSAQGASGEIAVEGKVPEIRCLIVPSRAVQYPEEARLFKSEGVVRVRLTFTGGEDRPQTEVFFSSGDDFRAVVLDHVGAYRMPCLERGESRVVTQEFQFVPGDGRKILTGDVRATEQRTRALCLKTQGGAPAYPTPSADQPSQGRVLARAYFEAPDTAPRIEIVFNGGSDRFARSVRQYMSGYRLPCFQASDFPLVVSQTFHFRMQGDAVALLKDATLSSLISNVVDLEKQHVRFDFTTMGCPFDVHFTLWQPHAKNVVREIERADPNRLEFIEWLRRVDLNAPRRLHDQLVGDSMTLSVPCVVLDLL